MKVMLAVLLIPFTLVVNNLTATPQDWRRIVPLKTTRAEAEGLLGPSREAYFAEYQLEEGVLFIEYSSDPCKPDRKGGWNVPENIVVSMSITPKHPKKLYELNLDVTKYRKSAGGDTPNVTYWITMRKALSTRFKWKSGLR